MRRVKALCRGFFVAIVLARALCARARAERSARRRPVEPEPQSWGGLDSARAQVPSRSLASDRPRLGWLRARLLIIGLLAFGLALWLAWTALVVKEAPRQRADPFQAMDPNPAELLPGSDNRLVDTAWAVEGVRGTMVPRLIVTALVEARVPSLPVPLSRCPRDARVQFIVGARGGAAWHRDWTSRRLVIAVGGPPITDLTLSVSVRSERPRKGQLPPPLKLGDSEVLRSVKVMRLAGYTLIVAKLFAPWKLSLNSLLIRFTAPWVRSRGAGSCWVSVPTLERLSWQDYPSSHTPGAGVGLHRGADVITDPIGALWQAGFHDELEPLDTTGTTEIVTDYGSTSQQAHRLPRTAAGNGLGRCPPVAQVRQIQRPARRGRHCTLRGLRAFETSLSYSRVLLSVSVEFWLLAADVSAARSRLASWAGQCQCPSWSSSKIAGPERHYLPSVRHTAGPDGLADAATNAGRCSWSRQRQWCPSAGAIEMLARRSAAALTEPQRRPRPSCARTTGPVLLLAHCDTRRLEQRAAPCRRRE